MNKWIQINSEVYSATSEIVSVNAADINYLKDKVSKTPNKRVRICVHKNSEDKLHEMLIVINKGSYVRPHKHLNKGESFHMIEGMLDVIIFNDDGSIREIIPLGYPGSGRNLFYRLSAPYFHTIVLRTDWVVFHETTNGPFVKNETIYAPWSPEISEIEAVSVFMKKLDVQSEKQCQYIR